MPYSEFPRRLGPADSAQKSLVSIVIPTCGRSDLLARAIRSVFAQTYSNWELLVVDDNERGSRAAADTQRVVAYYLLDDRLRYIAHGANRGGSQARNTGIAAATGEFVAFLDDDDEWLPDKLALQCEELESLPPTYAAVYCGYLVESSALAGTRTVPGRPQPKPFPTILVDNFIGTTSTLLCRRSVLEEIGLFDSRMPAAQDRELLIRLCRSYSIACVEDPLVRFHWHDGDRVTKRRDGKLEAQELLYGRYAQELRRHPKLHSRYLLDLGKLQLACQAGDKAARSFARSWLADPTRLSALAYALLAAIGGSLYEWVRRSTWRLRRGAAARVGRSR